MNYNKYWYDLLNYDEFTIGPFNVEVLNDTIRVRQNQRDKVYIYSREGSYFAMKNLCTKFNLNLHGLLDQVQLFEYPYLAESEQRFQSFY